MLQINLQLQPSLNQEKQRLDKGSHQKESSGRLKDVGCNWEAVLEYK